MRRNKDNSYEECTWEEAFESMREKMLTLEGSEMAAIIGEFADCESITALKDLFNRMDCDNFEIRSNSSNLIFHLLVKLSPDLRSNYLMNSTIAGVEDSDLLLIVGSNPRYKILTKFYHNYKFYYSDINYHIKCYFIIKDLNPLYSIVEF
jgi:NADH dehydrogenase/NADH:ubiquinone oxidoreductase subunit G